MLFTKQIPNNNITHIHMCRILAIRRLPHLKWLDCALVEERESRMGAADVSTAITPQLIQVRYTIIISLSHCLLPTHPITSSLFYQAFSTHYIKSKEPSLPPSQTHTQACSTAARGFAVVDGPGWEVQVHEVRIEHKHVRRITGLSGLMQVRVLSLHDNEIARIEGLEVSHAHKYIHAHVHIHALLTQRFLSSRHMR